ncbi:MAG: hypothetical protein NE330_04370, partial [Lentisphaeraceae bacterium]|nr:hypothetical protein [Lentisphaeraceae bacterium]
IIFAVGLKYAGYESVMFVAGTTFFLTMFSQFGTILGLVLCVPVAVTQFSIGGDGWNSLIALGVMGLVAIIVEKKLHWLMVVIPMSKEGVIPASMIKPKQQIVKVDGGPSFISRLLGIVFPLAFYGIVALAGYKVYSVYNDMSEGRKNVNEALDSLPENKQAFTVMEDYREKYPADREVLLTMSKAYLKSAKVDKALELATAFRDFKEPEASSEGNLITQGEEIVSRFLSKPRRSVSDKEAHKWLVVNYSELFKDYLQKDEYKKLAEAMLETDKNEIAAYTALSKHYLLKKDYVQCREWADKGLEIDSENVRLLCNITRIHIEEGNKQEALKAMINVDKVTTSDEEAEELRKLLLRL